MDWQGLLLFVLLRILPNRKSGSLTDALVMVATIVTWSFAIDILAGRVQLFCRLLHSDPGEIVREGQILVRNLRREFMTEDELRAQLRLQGVESERGVAYAYVEHDGRGVRYP